MPRPKLQKRNSRNQYTAKLEVRLKSAKKDPEVFFPPFPVVPDGTQIVLPG